MEIMNEIKQMNLQSENVFAYFEKIASIPHGSGNTKQISDYLVSFAKEHNLEYYQDEWNNVVMIKEASAGYEAEEPVIIQGHMDMVCEKESSCTKDLSKEGLSLFIDGDFLKAEKTTLGADDGIAVAMTLALLDAEHIPHPRLEIVITVDEEIGLLGAAKIDLSMLRSHQMLNLDSEEWGHFLTGCAGGMSVYTNIPVEYVTRNGLKCNVKISGLFGGHSGSEIDKERANADILLGRLFKTLTDRFEIGIADFSGGNKDNAIPRESSATLFIAEEDKEAFLETVETFCSVLKKEYSVSDPRIMVTAEIFEEQQGDVLSVSSMAKVIFYLCTVPNGIQHMSQNMKALVETSLNLGIMELKKESFYAAASVRSSVSTRKEQLRDKLEFLAEFLGGTIEVQGDYPAWEYRENSVVREKIGRVFQHMFGEAPVFETIHAGLECGVLSEKIKNLDCVSFGPDIFDAHTPAEKISISSTEKLWSLLLSFLEERHGL